MSRDEEIYCKPQVCSTWPDVVQWIEEFPSPNLSFGENGMLESRAWAFRGVKCSSYPLRPSIERSAEEVSLSWSALEVFVLNEFKARAPGYFAPALIPGDELTWLATMQHYAVPTRLLDFTYSPFVSLYFAIRGLVPGESPGNVKVDAIDTNALNRRFEAVALKAGRERSKRTSTSRKSKAVSFHPDDLATEMDLAQEEVERVRMLFFKAFSADGPERSFLKRNGCVCALTPSSLNPRLVSQQGLFLVNCVEESCLEESLHKMMDRAKQWRTAMEIPGGLAPEIEERLFRMNIHEQSLFPDLEGLAGLVRQQIRVQWRQR